MTVALTGSGGLFTRVGHYGGGVLDTLALSGGTATARVLAGANMVTRVGQIDADALASVSISSVVDGIYTALRSFQQSQNVLLQDFSSRSAQTVVQMVNLDTPLLSPTLSSALQVLISQMKTAVASVQASVPAAGAQTAVGTPNGNPVIVATVKDGQGLLREYLYAETVTFTCAQDSQSGGTLGSETFTVSGVASVSSLAYNWPAGSGASTTMTAVNGNRSNAGGNRLQNSGFATFTTTNVPDNWTILNGTAGTDVFNGTTGSSYDSTGCLQFTGTATPANAGSVAQTFATTPSTTVGAGGTSATLSAGTPYAVNAFVKVSSTPGAGVLEFSLVDGSNAIIADDHAVANSFTLALTGVSTTYVATNGVFRLPSILPAVVKLRIRLSTAISSGFSVYVSKVALNTMTAFYTGGPSLSVFSGSSTLIAGDAWTMAFTNTWGGFQQLFQRFFNMTGLGLILPSNVAPTVSDTLIT